MTAVIVGIPNNSAGFANPVEANNVNIPGSRRQIFPLPICPDIITSKLELAERQKCRHCMRLITFWLLQLAGSAV